MAETVTKKPWPLGGYAPGNYQNQCVSCDLIFHGDKRAVQCLECAASFANAAIAAPDGSFRKVAEQAYWLLAWSWQSHTSGPGGTFNMKIFAPEAREMMNSCEQNLFDALTELFQENAGTTPQNMKDTVMDRNAEQEEAEISFSLISQLIADGETSVEIKAIGEGDKVVHINAPWTAHRPRSFAAPKLSEALGAALNRRTQIAMSQGIEGPFEADDEIKRYLDGVVGAVEATNAEKHATWERYCKRGKVDWQEARGGYLPTVGMFNGHPVCISIYVETVNGCPILFYHATSRIVDHDMIKAWLDKNLPETCINRTDATNFHNVFPNGSKPTLESV